MNALGLLALLAASATGAAYHFVQGQATSAVLLTIAAVISTLALLAPVAARAYVKLRP